MLRGTSKIKAVLLVMLLTAAVFAQTPPHTPERAFDIYITPRYMIPVTDHISLLTFDVEGGIVWKNGIFLGVDMGAGIRGLWKGLRMLGDAFNEFEGGTAHYNEDETLTFTMTWGAGLNFGYTHDLPMDLQLAYGIFAGAWNISAETNKTPEFNYTKFGYTGPFIKLRWHAVEFAYRSIISFKSDWIADEHGSLGLINQFMVGYHFQTLGRLR